MPQYVLNLWEPVGPPPPPELLQPIMDRVGALDAEMRDAGVWLFAGGLHQPGASTVLRPQDGEVLVTDGPFLEGKEHLGGFTVIAVDDLDAALGWGRRLTEAAGLPVEVRPFRHDGRG
ncbi:YciI family protein [Cellulomonas endometrii]|uniref:YciI family protein n=1 Tax=Cellulomonas endometrii TaxID=3036301 RepID=UPI0024AE2F0F|nr:YciI family protein [Cellulomonas endometrii]